MFKRIFNSVFKSFFVHYFLLFIILLSDNSLINDHSTLNQFNHFVHLLYALHDSRACLMSFASGAWGV